MANEPHVRLALASLALLLLALCSPPCVSGLCESSTLCDVNRLPKPTKPETSDVTGGVLSILTGSLSVAAAIATGGASVAANAGLGVITGITGAVGASGDTGAWSQYQLQNDLVQTTDYLVCKMESIVGDAIYKVTEKMDQAALTKFNEAIQGITTVINEKCFAMNCLNASFAPPSQRNALTNNDCAQGTGRADAKCAGIKWDPAKPVLCQFKFNELEGVCDPNGQCYNVYDYTDASKALKGILQLFSQKDSLDNFNKFSSWMDMKGTVALAKGMLLKILVLQQLVLVDGAGGYNGDLKTFAKAMADNLQGRVDYHTDYDRLYTLIDSLSTGNTADPYKEHHYPVQGNNCHADRSFFGGLGSSDFWCKYPQGAYIDVTQTTRNGCDPDDERVHVHKFNLPANEGTSHKCGTYDENVAYIEGSGPYLTKAHTRCVDAWKAAYFDPAKRIDNCNFKKDVLSTLKKEAERLQKGIKKDLERVQQIVTALRSIASAGIPTSAFGLFRNTYFPMTTCA